MGHTRTAFLIIGGLLFSMTAGIRADSLQMKNGDFVQGKYMGGTERAVQFEANGKMRLYDIAQILSISFAAASVDGGMPSNSAEAGQNGNEDRCLAAKPAASSSATKGQLQSAKMQGASKGSQATGKAEPGGKGMSQANRAVRTNWTRAGDCESTSDTSFAGARFAWLPKRIDVWQG